MHDEVGLAYQKLLEALRVFHTSYVRMRRDTPLAGVEALAQAARAYELAVVNGFDDLGLVDLVDNLEQVFAAPIEPSSLPSAVRISIVSVEDYIGDESMVIAALAAWRSANGEAGAPDIVDDVHHIWEEDPEALERLGFELAGSITTAEYVDQTLSEGRIPLY